MLLENKEAISKLALQAKDFVSVKSLCPGQIRTFKQDRVQGLFRLLETFEIGSNEIEIVEVTLSYEDFTERVACFLDIFFHLNMFNVSFKEKFPYCLITKLFIKR